MDKYRHAHNGGIYATWQIAIIILFVLLFHVILLSFKMVIDIRDKYFDNQIKAKLSAVVFHALSIEIMVKSMKNGTNESGAL